MNKDEKIIYTSVCCVLIADCVKGPTTKLDYEAFGGLNYKVSFSKLASATISPLRLLISVWSWAFNWALFLFCIYFL